MGDEKRRRRSWREIDRARDSGKGRASGPGASRPSRGRAAASRSHRNALDRLFESGKVGELVKRRDEETGLLTSSSASPSRRALTEKIERAPDRAAKVAALDAYLERFSPPADFDLLTHLLDHPDPDVVGDALDRMEELLVTDKPRRTRTLVARLKTLRDLSEWGRLRRRAEELLEQI